MEENYLIKIIGTMESDGDADTIELTTRGSFVKRGGSFFISYNESEATGYKGITTVKVDESGNKVTMLRFGPNQSQLIIEKGRRHVCHYETGQGALSLGISADEIIYDLQSDKGGNVNFSYLLDSNTNSISRNEVKITVKPVM